MKSFVLPILALSLASFVVPATAGATCAGHEYKDQTAEEPKTDPVPSPST